MTVRFLHIRECDEEGNMLNKGGCTIAYTVSPELDAIFVHIAICNPKDQFVKRIGRELAAQRLKEEEPLDILPYEHPYVDTVLDWFMAFYNVDLTYKDGRCMTDWINQATDDDLEDDDTLEPLPLIREGDYADAVQRLL